MKKLVANTMCVQFSKVARLSNHLILISSRIDSSRFAPKDIGYPHRYIVVIWVPGRDGQAGELSPRKW